MKPDSLVVFSSAPDFLLLSEPNVKGAALVLLEETPLLESNLNPQFSEDFFSGAVAGWPKTKVFDSSGKDAEVVVAAVVDVPNLNFSVDSEVVTELPNLKLPVDVVTEALLSEGFPNLKLREEPITPAPNLGNTSAEPVGSGGALGFGVWQATHLWSEDLFWIKHTLHSQEPAGFRNLAIKGSTFWLTAVAAADGGAVDWPGLRVSHAQHFGLSGLFCTIQVSHSQAPAGFKNLAISSSGLDTELLNLGGFGAGAGFGVSQAIHLIASGLFCIMQVSHSQVPVGLTNLAIRGSSLLGGLAEAVVTVGAFSVFFPRISITLPVFRVVAGCRPANTLLVLLENGDVVDDLLPPPNTSITLPEVLSVFAVRKPGDKLLLLDAEGLLVFPPDNASKTLPLFS